MRSMLVFVAAAAVSLGALAQAKQAEQDHAAHHPEGASAPASAPKKAPAKPKAAAAKPRAAAPAASSASGAMGKSAGMGMGMGMGGNMQQMHDAKHKPGGMHDQMHGKRAEAMQGGPMKGMPAASAASK